MGVAVRKNKIPDRGQTVISVPIGSVLISAVRYHNEGWVSVFSRGLLTKEDKFMDYTIHVIRTGEKCPPDHGDGAANFLCTIPGVLEGMELHVFFSLPASK